MAAQHVTCSVVSGPNKGDSIGLSVGACRLVGRHLADDETVMLDRDGNRALDRACAEVITAHFAQLEREEIDAAQIDVSTFERGPDFILADGSISRLHAMLFYDQEGPALVDLGSSNGTYVNGQRVSSSTLAHGDVVALGNSSFTVQLN